MTDEQARTKRLIGSAINDAKYPLTVMGAPLRMERWLADGD